MKAVELVASWRKCLDSACEQSADGLIDHWHLVVGPDEGGEVHEVGDHGPA